MPERLLTPTLGTNLGAWSDLANALGWSVDGYGATSAGAGYAAFSRLHGRYDISPRDGIAGFEVELRARLTSGSSPGGPTTVTALLDLGSAQVVSKASRRVGWVKGPNDLTILEASNDGVTWVDAYTGIVLGDNRLAGPFAWSTCYDTTDVTTTAYRYWRTYVTCEGDSPIDPDPRIGDFRLEVGGSPATYAEKRFGLVSGSSPVDWPDGTASDLFTDNAACDTTTYVGGNLLAGSLNVGLSGDRATLRGSAKNVPLSGDFETYLVGGSGDLWGASWTAEELRSELFSLLIERGSAFSEVEIDAIRVTIYVISYGGPLAMRENVRQQILIGREAGVNAVQTLTVTGTPTGGSFRLTFNGVETANIAYNANAAAVQAALEAISSIGSGNVVCGGGALPGTPVTITFVGDLAATPQNLITVTTPAFTGGTAPAGAVTNTTTGVRSVGAGASANVRLRHFRIQPQPAPDFLSHVPAGEKLTNHHVLLKEAAEGPAEGLPTYDEMGWPLSGIIARPGTSTLQTSVAYRHQFALSNRRRDNIATFQAEYGDHFSRAHRVKGMVLNSLELAFRQDGIDLGGSIFAKQIEDGVAMSLGVATVQALTFSGTGTIRLRYRGQETADLNVATMTASDVQTALRALPDINGSTELAVTGASSPFTITFGNAEAGPFKGIPQPLLEVRVISGSPVASVAITTRGGYVEYPGVVILPRHIEVFLSPTLAGLETSKLSGVFASGLNFGDRANPVYNLNRSETSWFDYTETPPNLNFNLLAMANSEAMQFLSQARADQILFLRILATGPLIGASAFPHRLQIDCPVKVSDFGPFGENQDTYAFEYELSGVEDTSTNTSLVVILDNGVSSYP